jgi:hypothetical protein
MGVAALSICLGATITHAQQFYGVRPGMYPTAAGQPTAPAAAWYPASPGVIAYPQVWNVAPVAYAAPASYMQVLPGVYQQAPPAPLPPPATAATASTVPVVAEEEDLLFPDGFLRGPNGLGALLASLAPYSDGGCCAPHWFDLEMEAVLLRRDRASSTVPFSSLNFNLGIPPTIVLSSDDMKLGWEPGMRVSGTYQVGAGSNLEVTYLGLNQWSDSKTVSVAAADPNRFWSPFSEFGTDPIGSPFLAYVDVDRARQHSLAFKTQLNTVELDYRRRWSGPSCLFQGSWLTGFRYFQLRDKLRYYTWTPDNVSIVRPSGGFMYYDITTVNHMYGWQLGGDVWACLLPGLSLGAECKGGVYGNDAKQKTAILSGSIDPALREAANDTRVAFVSELDFLLTYRINHNFTLRGGYMMLYAQSVALAPENFNKAPPAAFDPSYTGGAAGRPVRVVGIDADGDAFWHGWTIGAEYMW